MQFAHGVMSASIDPQIKSPIGAQQINHQYRQNAINRDRFDDLHLPYWKLHFLMDLRSGENYE